MHHFPRPSELTLSVTREPVDGLCPVCGRESLARYPVVAEHGWTIVTKCQTCLHSVERSPHSPLGSITLLSDSV
jgi:vanillate/4-hydroxybenzoate decarboxylase subunit D